MVDLSGSLISIGTRSFRINKNEGNIKPEGNSGKPSLMAVAKSAPIALAGNILNVLLLSVLAILIARYVDQGEFGFFCLCLALVRFLSFISGLGLPQGLPRYIAYQLGKGECGKAWGSIVSSVFVISLLGPFFGLLLFFNAGSISQLLGKPELAQTIRIMALAVPFMALANLLVSQLRATHDVKGGVLFKYIFRPFTGLVLVFFVVIFRLSYTWVLWAYSASFLVTFIVLVLYAKRKISQLIPTHTYTPALKEIVLFSLPLLGSGLLLQIVTSTDTLLLGYFEPARSVAVYNSALRLARLIPILSTSAAFTYLPVASQLSSQNKVGEIGRVYATISKWVFIVTLPLFLYMFFAPDVVLRLSFGAKYAAAGTPLVILSFGYFMRLLFGLSVVSCVALGKVRIVFVLQLVTVIANVILDILLIPKYGIAGASVGSAISLVAGTVLANVAIYRSSAIHPFSRSYVRIILFAVGIGIVLSLLPIQGYINNTIVGAILFFVFVLVTPVAGVLATKAITEEDASIIGQIEKKITKNTYFTDKYMKRFRKD